MKKGESFNFFILVFKKRIFIFEYGDGVRVRWNPPSGPFFRKHHQ